MNAAEKLASFIAQTQANIRHVGEEFDEPDDDWMSVAFLDSGKEIYMIGMAGDMFASNISKDILAEWLKMAMSYFSAERYAVLLNVHGLDNPSEEDWNEHLNGKPLCEFPNAQEMLVLIAGDAEQELAYQAQIFRSGDTPPTLGEWELTPRMEGRFAGLNERMRKVA